MLINGTHLLRRRAGLSLPEGPLLLLLLLCASVSFFLSGLLKSFLMAEATLLSFARADMMQLLFQVGVRLAR